MSLLFSTGVIAASGLAKGAPGMVLVKPTTINATGGSGASINTNGSVTFTGITDVSLNGVFTADFDNYVIVLRGTASGNLAINFRMRSAGSDNATSNSYRYQRVEASSTIIQGGRSTTTSGVIVADLVSTTAYGFHAHVYAPFLAQPTGLRGVSMANTSGGLISEFVNSHNQATSYDGITLISSANSITGLVAVYGVRS